MNPSPEAVALAEAYNDWQGQLRAVISACTTKRMLSLVEAAKVQLLRASKGYEDICSTPMPAAERRIKLDEMRRLCAARLKALGAERNDGPYTDLDPKDLEKPKTPWKDSDALH